MSEIPWNATVARRRDTSPRTFVLHVAPDEGHVHEFEPGQFVQLGWPREREPDAPPDARIKWDKRSYSIASSPTERDAYELFIANVADGKLTPRLQALREGARVWCDQAPKGHFTLERVPNGADLVLVATGTGISPFVSMLRRYRGTGRWRRLAIVHGARERVDLGYDLELTSAAHDEMRYVPVLSRDPNPGPGLRGHVQVALEVDRCERWLGFPLDPSSVHVMLCGNPAMIDDVRAQLAPRGFHLDTLKTPGNLHFERYW